VLVALSLAASVVMGLVFSEIALWPVGIIQETANRMGSDNLSQRIPVSDVRDEISDLARLLNEMFDRLESSFNEIRRFSAEASHELKTPLSVLRLEAEKLLVNEGLTRPKRRRSLWPSVIPILANSLRPLFPTPGCSRNIRGSDSRRASRG
jgi:signal transduction histidine kinase